MRGIITETGGRKPEVEKRKILSSLQWVTPTGNKSKTEFCLFKILKLAMGPWFES
jgi:hypothetical protein